MTRMTARSRAICFIGLLAVTMLFSGCAAMDSLKHDLAMPFTREQPSALPNDLLHFAERLQHMPAGKRKKLATSLRQKMKNSTTPQENLQLALLALYVGDGTIPAAEGLAALQHVEKEEARRGKNAALSGLVYVLRQALLEIDRERRHGENLAAELHNQKKELAKKLHSREETDDLAAALQAEKKKTEELTRQLQKLLEIEKIVEKRK